AHRAYPQIVRWWSVHGARIDRCSAVRTECVDAFGATLGCFDVFPWFAGQQRERRARRRHDGSVSRTRQLLAIRAVADRDLFRIYDGLISDGAAVTFAVDFHPRRSPSLAVWAAPKSTICQITKLAPTLRFNTLAVVLP